MDKVTEDRKNLYQSLVFGTKEENNEVLQKEIENEKV